VALRYAKVQGFVEGREGGVHQALWRQWYILEGHDPDIGHSGDALKSKRHKAVYNLDRPFTYDPMKIVDEAQEVFEMVEAATRA
jgi:hypothetical protein